MILYLNLSKTYLKSLCDGLKAFSRVLRVCLITILRNVSNISNT